MAKWSNNYDAELEAKFKRFKKECMANIIDVVPVVSDEVCCDETELIGPKEKPDCELLGKDGNIFNLLTLANSALRDNGQYDDCNELTDKVVDSMGYYDALSIISDYVNITGDETVVETTQNTSHLTATYDSVVDSIVVDVHEEEDEGILKDILDKIKEINSNIELVGNTFKFKVDLPLVIKTEIMDCILQYGEQLASEGETLTESKADTDKFIEFAGNDLANRFIQLKQSKRIKGQESDFGYWYKQGVDKLSTYVDEIEAKQTRKDKDKQAREGASLIYSDSKWKVYHIKSYEASVKYGKDSQWCITGCQRWGGGPTYWNQYTDRGISFYFYLTNDTKYALAVYKDGNFEIYNATDDRVDYIPNGPNNITDENGRKLPDIGKYVETVEILWSTATIPTLKQIKAMRGSAKALNYWTSDIGKKDGTHIAYDIKSGMYGDEKDTVRSSLVCYIQTNASLIKKLGLKVGDKINHFTIVADNTHVLRMDWLSSGQLDYEATMDRVAELKSKGNETVEVKAKTKSEHYSMSELGMHLEEDMSEYEEATEAGAIANVPGKHKNICDTQDCDNRLELDETEAIMESFMLHEKVTKTNGKLASFDAEEFMHQVASSGRSMNTIRELDNDIYYISIHYSDIFGPTGLENPDQTYDLIVVRQYEDGSQDYEKTDSDLKYDDVVRALEVWQDEKLNGTTEDVDRFDDDEIEDLELLTEID